MHTHTRTHAHTHTRTHAHTHTRTHAHTHARTHAHTGSGSEFSKFKSSIVAPAFASVDGSGRNIKSRWRYQSGGRGSAARNKHTCERGDTLPLREIPAASLSPGRSFSSRSAAGSCRYSSELLWSRMTSKILTKPTFLMRRNSGVAEAKLRMRHVCI
jgi:hypothetical protein